MPTADFFDRFGFYSRREWLDREDCERICLEMEESPSRLAGVLPYGLAEEQIREHFKSRLESEMPPATVERVRGELLRVMPDVAQRYGLELRGLQKLKFTTYREGDFYKPHVDHFTPENTPEEVRGIPQSSIAEERRVAAIVFFNDECPAPVEGTYQGGNLSLHGLQAESVFGAFGLPVVGEAGLLFTFPPSVMHEVTPVVRGTRYSLATWYI